MCNLIGEFEAGRFRRSNSSKAARTTVMLAIENSVLTFLMVEFEIVCWINYVDQVDLVNLYHDVSDAELTLGEAI